MERCDGLSTTANTAASHLPCATTSSISNNGVAITRKLPMTPFQAVHASSPLHHGSKAQPPPPHQAFPDPNHLAPEDAFLAQSLARKQHDGSAHARSNGSIINGELANARAGKSARRPRDKERGRSGSRRRKGVWKKLLWVKQPCIHLRTRYETS